MTSSSQNPPELSPPGKLLSLVALLAATLYFTGWIYRWAYFGFFQIEVTALNLPVESFYLAAFQALFGHTFTVLKTAIACIFTIVAILATLQLFHIFSDRFLRKIYQNSRLSYPSQRILLKFLYSLIDELAIVFWVLTALFFLAQWQGDRDAWRDAVNETSRLPVITVIIPEGNAAVGRNLDNPLLNPSNFRIIGDRNLYDRLLGQELTDTSKPEQLRVWRLLADRDGYFFVFPALPSKDRNLSIPVLTIYESGNGDQLTIISPTVNDSLNY